MMSGRLVTSGFAPEVSVGARVHWPLASRLASEQPLVSQPLAAIHRAPGATPIWLRAVGAHHRAHRVRAVAVVVAGQRAVGRAGVARVVPAVVVVDPAGRPAAVPARQRRVVELHAGVDVGHQQALAAVAVLRPDVVGVDGGDPPLDGVDRGLVGAGGRLHQRELGGGGDPLDAGEGREPGGERTVDVLHQDPVRHPERLVRNPFGGELLQRGGLALAGGLLQRVDHRLAAGVVVLDLRGRPEVGAGVEHQPRVGGGAAGDLLGHARVDRGGPVRGGRRGRGGDRPGQAHDETGGQRGGQRPHPHGGAAYVRTCGHGSPPSGGRRGPLPRRGPDPARARSARVGRRTDRRRASRGHRTVGSAGSRAIARPSSRTVVDP